MSEVEEARRDEREAVLCALLLWVKERWGAEVADRPMENIHRRTLDGTWKQVERKLQAMLDGGVQ